MNLHRCIVVSIVLLGATALLPSLAAAQGTPEQRAACTGDALSICGEFVPNVDMITACMKKNVKKLSPGCQAFFRPGAQAQRRAPASRPVDPYQRHPVY